MNVQDRQRREWAKIDGQRAHIMGLPSTANPYRASATWGVHYFWLMGWNKEHNECKQRNGGECVACQKREAGVTA